MSFQMAQSVASLANPAGLRSGGFKRKKPGFLKTELPVDQQLLASSLFAGSAEQFLKLEGKLFVACQAAIIHRQDLTYAANGQLRWAGQTQNEFIGIELFQIANRMNTQKHEGFFGLHIVLKNHIQWSVDRNT